MYFSRVCGDIFLGHDLSKLLLHIVAFSVILPALEL